MPMIDKNDTPLAHAAANSGQLSLMDMAPLIAEAERSTAFAMIMRAVMLAAGIGRLEIHDRCMVEPPRSTLSTWRTIDPPVSIYELTDDAGRPISTKAELTAATADPVGFDRAHGYARREGGHPIGAIGEAYPEGSPAELLRKKLSAKLLLMPERGETPALLARASQIAIMFEPRSPQRLLGELVADLIATLTAGENWPLAELAGQSQQALVINSVVAALNRVRGA